ncbi:LysR substrate-binding domain-containing protein [Streptomyces antimycoticus]|uniref:LysR substrate-binding domain-containing protein n=1 Tax=Streptomyces antimycoticus TaxID=68175 RepID=UPI000A38387A|nr:LysR substrate-binding domain-containing protein [Streptomyces antimycoticus]
MPESTPGAGSPRFTLRQLEYLVELSGAGSFAAAAARLHLSPSAMAVAIGELERMIGSQLTVRKRAQGVSLTPVGREVAEQARRVLLEAARLGDLPGNKLNVRGTVHLGCYMTLAPAELPDLLYTFSDQFPQSSVQLIEADQDRLMQLLLEGEIDLAIMYNIDLDPALRTIPMSSRKVHLLLAERHPLAQRQTVSVCEVAEEPMVLLDVPPATESAMSVCRAVGVTPKIRFRTMTHELARALVGRGLGYALLAQHAPGRLTGAGRAVAAIPIADPLEPLPVVLVQSPTLTPGAATEAFVSLVRKRREGSVVS